jgi:hypothetical protein
MNAHSDLEQWRRLWRRELLETAGVEERKAQLVTETHRQTLRMKLAMVGPVLVTLIAGGSALANAINWRDAADAVLAVGTWVFIVLVWAGALWLARDTWRPLDTTTQEFLRISIRRCQSTLHAFRFGAVMYVLGVAGALLWQYWYISRNIRAVLTSRQFVIFVVVLGPALIYFLSSIARRKRAELEELLDLQRQLRD